MSRVLLRRAACRNVQRRMVMAGRCLAVETGVVLAACGILFVCFAVAAAMKPPEWRRYVYAVVEARLTGKGADLLDAKELPVVKPGTLLAVGAPSPDNEPEAKAAAPRFDKSRVQPLERHISPRIRQSPSSRFSHTPDRFSPKSPEGRVKEKAKELRGSKELSKDNDYKLVKGKGNTTAKGKVISPSIQGTKGKFGFGYPVMDGKWWVTRLPFMRSGFNGLIYQEVPATNTLLIQCGQALEEFGVEAVIPLWDNSVTARIGDKIAFDIGSLIGEKDGKASPMASNVIIRQRGKAVNEAVVKGSALAAGKQGAVAPKAVAKQSAEAPVLGKKTKEAAVKSPVMAASKQGAVAPKAVAKQSGEAPVPAKKAKEASAKGPELAAAKEGASDG